MPPTRCGWRLTHARPCARSWAGQRARVETVRPGREPVGRGLPDRRRLRARRVAARSSGRGCAMKVVAAALARAAAGLFAGSRCAACRAQRPPDHRQPESLRRRDPRRSRRAGAAAGYLALQPRSARQLDACRPRRGASARPAGRSEEVLALAPDMVVADPLPCSRHRAARWSRLGIAVETHRASPDRWPTARPRSRAGRRWPATAARAQALVCADRGSAGRRASRAGANRSRPCCGSRAGIVPGENSLVAHAGAQPASPAIPRRAGWGRALTCRWSACWPIRRR